MNADLSSMEVTDVASVRDGTVGQINDVSLTLLSEAAAAMDNYSSFLTLQQEQRVPAASFLDFNETVTPTDGITCSTLGTRLAATYYGLG